MSASLQETHGNFAKGSGAGIGKSDFHRVTVSVDSPWSKLTLVVIDKLKEVFFFIAKTFEALETIKSRHFGVVESHLPY